MITRTSIGSASFRAVKLDGDTFQHFDCECAGLFLEQFYRQGLRFRLHIRCDRNSLNMGSVSIELSGNIPRLSHVRVLLSV